MRLHSVIASLVIALALIAGRSAAAQDTPKPTDSALLPGDAVRVLIWREPDLSGEFVINELGVVTFPMLGKRDVTNVPLEGLREKLIAEYSAQLRNPSITITPLRRIYVLGEVTKPGLYSVDPTITLAGALALAGGATPLGSLDHLRILRDGKLIRKNVSANTSLSTVNIRSADQVFVDRRSWLDRNSTFAASALLSAATLAITLLAR